MSAAIHWSALDNFEWVFGFRPTFGLIAVDRTTFERTVKPSARWLGAIARPTGSRSDRRAGAVRTARRERDDVVPGCPPDVVAEGEQPGVCERLGWPAPCCGAAVASRWLAVDAVEAAQVAAASADPRAVSRLARSSRVFGWRGTA
jgi:hypothetical protein